MGAVGIPKSDADVAIVASVGVSADNVATAEVGIISVVGGVDGISAMVVVEPKPEVLPHSASSIADFDFTTFLIDAGGSDVVVTNTTDREMESAVGVSSVAGRFGVKLNVDDGFARKIGVTTLVHGARVVAVEVDSASVVSVTFEDGVTEFFVLIVRAMFVSFTISESFAVVDFVGSTFGSKDFLTVVAVSAIASVEEAVKIHPSVIVERNHTLFFEVDLVRIEETDSGRDDGSIAADRVPASLDVEVVKVRTDAALGVTVLVITLETGLGGDGGDPDALSAVKTRSSIFVFEGVVVDKGIGERFAVDIVDAVEEAGVSGSGGKGGAGNAITRRDEDVLADVGVGEDLSDSIATSVSNLSSEEIETAGVDDE